LCCVCFWPTSAGLLTSMYLSMQGEDICMALQTHINDIMMKRLTKAKAAMVTAGSADAATSQGASAPTSDGGYGPRYEAHISEMQAKLDTANNRWDGTLR
jgi:hypothetical protein